MKQPTITAKEMTVKLNGLKEHIRDISMVDLIKILQREQIPYARFLPKFLVEQGIFFSKKKGIYNWVSQEPIFYKVIEHFLEGQRKICCAAAKRHTQKKKDNRVQNVLTEENCVNFLKSQGYRIYKPVVEHVEV